MKTIESDKPIQVSGGNLPDDYKSKKFYVGFLDNLTPSQAESVKYGQLNINFHRVRDTMTGAEIDHMVESAELEKNGLPFVVVLATDAGKKVRSPEAALEDAVTGVLNLPISERVKAIEKLEADLVRLKLEQDEL